MRLQLLPQILCLFVTLSVFSYTIKPIKIFKESTVDKLTVTKPSSNFSTLNNKDNNAHFSTSKISSFNSKNYLPVSYLKSRLNEKTLLDKGFSYNFVMSSSPVSNVIRGSLSSQTNLFSQGLFYGFIVALVLLNLVFYFIFEEKLFIKFSLAIVALTLVLFFTDGFFQLNWTSNNVFQTQFTQASLLFVATSFGLLFTSKYLSVKEFYPKLKKVSFIILATAITLLVTALVTGNVFFINLTNAVLYGIISIYFITGVLLFSKKNYAKFYVIGTFIPLLFSIDFFVLRNFEIDFLFTETIHLKVAYIFEIILLSYAILYRMQAVAEEDDLKQTEMQIFLKNQDLMSRTQIEKLTDDVYLENLIMQHNLNGLEIKLLQYISEGKTNEKIARKLKITKNKVVEYTQELYEKLEISEHVNEDYKLLENQPDYIYN